jgi:aspartate/tyrosine/aromatic aminotransferase
MLRSAPRLALARSPWASVAACPPDPILGLVAAFKLDDAPRKVNLAQGAYRTEEGQPCVLEAVRLAEARLVADPTLNKEYLGIEGNPEFNALTARFVFGGDCPALGGGRVATLQTLSGTGALRVAADWLRLFAPASAAGTIYLPRPSWGNHAKIFERAGLSCGGYAYLDGTGTGLDFEGLYADLAGTSSGGGVPSGSAVLLHACAHNPSGVDLSAAQWEALAEVFAERGHVALFDSAYQGYATGDPEADALAVRTFVRRGLLPIVCQSYAKSMGLYGERVGAINIVCADGEEMAAVLSQVKQSIIRPAYSSPPLHGSRIAAAILGDAELRALWLKELAAIAERIRSIRAQLTTELERLGAGGAGRSWQHIVDQIGMFAFTGLAPEDVDTLLADHHVYLTRDGRLSIAGLAGKDIPYVAAAIAAVLAKKSNA